ncbi:aldo/keto reductase [Streptomyces sp. V4-01]|uniref:Aldo/keto reductase n=1 Tax=Actinacidiphila polyblastidii TaxID=3110430 RepID=A0ABU7PFZ5_9ACTN|nr:aldo/keto reductase [Streptomyces sp. V4-01]
MQRPQRPRAMMREPLPIVPLGSNGPLVGAQGLGCMGMSEMYGRSDRAESLETLELALDCGVTLFDTSDAYGSGENEELIGPFLRRNRRHALISTKFGLVRRPGDPFHRRIDNSPRNLRRSVEASLRRLGVDSIDLYFVHRLDPGTPVEDTVASMARLVAEGKVCHLGLSEVTGAQLRAAHNVHAIAAVQSEWSLFSRDVESDVVQAASDLGVALMPSAPLGRGFLAGAFTDAGTLPADDFRRHTERFTGDNAQRNAAILAPLRAIAAERGATPAQVALAWLHDRTRVHAVAVVPVPGTRHRARLLENVKSVRLHLSAPEVAQLDGIAAQVAGRREIGLAFESARRN